MKAQERHRLEQNVLADWLGNAIEKSKPFLTPVLVAAAIAVVVFVIASWWMRRGAESAGAAWAKLYAAISGPATPASLEAIAEQYAGTNVAHWATMTASDIRLQEGCRGLFASDRASAIQELRRAVDGCTRILNASTQPALRERALFCRARAYESLAAARQSEALSNAIADYKELLGNEEWAEGPLGTLARHSLENLGNPEFTKFLDQFAAYEAKPRGTAPGLGGARPPKTVPEPNSPSEFSSLMNLGGNVKAGEKEPAKAGPAKSEPVKPAPGKADAAKPATVSPAKAEAPKGAPPKTDSGKTAAPKG